jgi:hypothetical protein
VKALTPLQSLLLLALAGTAVAGWAWGLHWRRVATGDLFSADERLIFQFQDQIEALNRETESLRQRLRELEGEPEAEPRDSTAAPVFPANDSEEEGGASPVRPVLPAPPQRIETH